ncbi:MULTISPECIES: glycoside hydrolase/phage tail family protein [Rhodopseudomonas]|uniref:Gene transfer agent n=1 Tax=Rhodopseudomonas palustris TaxID=1076 RepID=A0A0D7F5P4_RHOPL|nr:MULTISPECIES: glycoside hydrolase/phage tail family protein [Rhodopseudomonas]KIZ47032.1 Gene transfer agent [Rhodopseudomonas palustris]MDF3813998.1 glycoside hydrolase/phage tail family protein [Rhodopseudomonas sp. BAL398]WOK19959.1 glycoside hydrolase/phage tail family protein [Rhodopseudomonas sp. BAL398]
MAALVLSVAGGAVGALFGPVGALAGRLAGALIGNALDQQLFGGSGNRSVEGPRLADLDVMASTEGAPIPRVYGRARLSGQVIWATELEEVISTETTSSGGKGGGSGPTTTTTTYSYFANFAVALCEGAIGRVARIWADGKPLDLSGVNHRVHRGTEDQGADELIVAKEGAANAPAYRGTAYVVFERLPLADYGNRIPQLSFEIIRPVGQLEQMVRAVTLIPGTTEFGYEPATRVRWLDPGHSAPENRHVANAASDLIESLDDLQGICPGLQRVAVVVAWFGSDLRAQHCTVRPGVENRDKLVSRTVWAVDGTSRADAWLVSQVGGRPAFGGTPSDDSVVHLIGELKARGLKVTFYPFVMMDVPAGNALPNPWTGAPSQPPYPWRGRITCDPAPGQGGSPQGTATAAAQVANFFNGGAWNYRRMILHYARLCASAGGVDAFLIGSELKALTRVRSGPGTYPAVDALVALAAEVKAIVGGTLVTYGADWTEYGADAVTPDGSELRFPLDPLWASSAIGAVGIDYYAPLADWRDDAGHLDQALAASTYDRAYLAGNVAAGEGYDWYYADDSARAAQHRSAITDGLGKPWVWRVKDIWNWWSQPHHERVGGAELPPTAWSPMSKPIWLTEVGCPAVDKGANQPSVFPDPKSSENFAPYFSSGERDDLMQRRYLEALIAAFDPAFGAAEARNPVSPVYGGRMIEVSAIHLWTWDARPYPVFPAADEVWSDAPNWQTGHWLTGRLGGAPLDALVGRLLQDAGVGGVDTSALRDGCDGYVVDRAMSPRAMIEPLALAYAFNATAADGTLRFIQRGGTLVMEIAEEELVAPDEGAPSRLTRAQETELPHEIAFGFTDALMDYRRSAATSRRLVGGANRTLRSDLTVVTHDGAAARRADILLQDLWAGRERASFALGLDRLALAPGDVVALTLNQRRRLFEIEGLVDTTARQVTARSIDLDVFATPQRAPQRAVARIPPALGPVQALWLDLPVIDAAAPSVLTRLAIFANPWPGSVTVWNSADGASYQPVAIAAARATIGETLDALPRGPTALWDRGNAFRVRLFGGALASLPDANVLAGGNAAALRNAEGAWEIVQFAHAELVDGHTYRLSRLLRGQAGSEAAIGDPLPAGATFVLLDRNLVTLAQGLDALGRTMQLRIAASNRSHDDASAVAITVTPGATALMPLAPVHLAAIRKADGVHISWIRRSRIDGDGWGVEVPLGEEIEAYRLEILSGGGGVSRAIACAAPQALYAAADEIADFGAPQPSLRLRVSQISATVGAGFPADITVTL